MRLYHDRAGPRPTPCHLLEDNRPELLRNGIWYPEVGLFWQADRPHKQAGHAGFIGEASDKRSLFGEVATQLTARQAI